MAGLAGLAGWIIFCIIRYCFTLVNMTSCSPHGVSWKRDKQMKAMCVHICAKLCFEGFSGAELAAVINEAVLLTLRQTNDRSQDRNHISCVALCETVLRF